PPRRGQAGQGRLDGVHAETADDRQCNHALAKSLACSHGLTEEAVAEGPARRERSPLRACEVAGAQSIRNDEKCIEQKNASARSALSRTSPRSIDYLPFGLCHNVSPLGESPCGSESHHQHPR